MDSHMLKTAAIVGAAALLHTQCASRPLARKGLLSDTGRRWSRSQRTRRAHKARRWRRPDSPLAPPSLCLSV